MAYTVTATNSDGSAGIWLQVEVLTGATESGGASANISDGASGTTTLTPNFSGSFIAEAWNNAQTSVAAPTAATNNSILTVAAHGDSAAATASLPAPAAFYYSGTVTAGTGVTVGSGNYTGTANAELAAYEVPNASGQSWAEDSSTPAWATTTSTNTVTTASFTPPGGAVLVAVVVCNYNGVANPTTTLSVSSSPALTWTLRKASANSTVNGGTAIFTATVPAATVPPPAQAAKPGRTWQRRFHHPQILPTLQSPQIKLVGQASQAGGNVTGALTFTYSSTAGNSLIIAGHLFDNGGNYSVLPTGVSDSAGNVWKISTSNAQSPPTQQDTVSPNHQCNFIAWATPENQPGGIVKAVTSVTLTNAGQANGPWNRVSLSEWANIGQFDNSWAGGTTSSVTSANLGPVTVSTSGELVIGTLDAFNQTPTTTGWTLFSAAGGDILGYQLNPAIGSFSSAQTFTSTWWDGTLAVFSPIPAPAHVSGPPITPLCSPVAGKVRGLPSKGRVSSSRGVFAQTGPSVRALTGPVASRGRGLPPKGRTGSNRGTFAQAGPAVRALTGPVASRVRPLPVRGSTVSRAGVRAQSGPPVTPLRGPVGAGQRAPGPFVKGRARWNAGVFTSVTLGQGPPVYPLRGPVHAWPLPPLRGRVSTNPGVFNGTGPKVYPLRGPVMAVRPGPFRAGRVSSNPGKSAQTGPRVYPLHGPVHAWPPAPLRGRTQARYGTWTFVVVGAGPPVYPLRGPVQARQPLPARGRITSNPGVRAQSGPPVTPLRKPVAAARTGMLRGGRCAWNPGTYTAVVTGQGPPVYPLRSPVRTRPQPPMRGRCAWNPGAPVLNVAPAYPLHGPVRTRPQPPMRGRCAGSRGVRAQTGPPVTPLRGPVSPFRPGPYLSGRCAHNPGVRAQTGPPVLPLHGPVGVGQRAPGPFLKGHSAGRYGVFTPPPLISVARSVSTVTDPRDGTSRITATATATSVVTDPGDGTSKITGATSSSGVNDPRDGTSRIS